MFNFIEENLSPGEVLLHRAQLHWVVMLPTFALSLLILFCGLWWAWLENLPIVAFLCVSFVCALLLWKRIKMLSFEFGITNRRIIYKKGVLSLDTDELFIGRVESLYVHQDIGGRLLNYGIVTVRGVGSSWEPFPMISDPLKLKFCIHEELAAQSKAQQENQGGMA